MTVPFACAAFFRHSRRFTARWPVLVSARIGPLCAVGVLDSKIEPGRVFDRSVPLDETPDGYRAMDQREALKVMIEP